MWRPEVAALPIALDGNTSERTEQEDRKDWDTVEQTL